MEVASTFTANARRLGMVSAFGTALLSSAYAVVLVVGVSSLESPPQPVLAANLAARVQQTHG